MLSEVNKKVLKGALIIIIVILMTLVMAHRASAQNLPQQENSTEIVCPEGYRCIPDDIAQEWKDILEHRQCMDTSLDEMLEDGTSEDLSLTFEEYHVIITRDNQVFDKDEMEAVLRWCDYTISFHTKPNLSISLAEENDPVWGLRLRVRLGASFWPLAFADPEVDYISPVILVEPFFFHHFHLAAYGGLDTFGVVAGVDLFKNLNFFAGVGATWKSTQVGPVLGLSLSFN